MLLHLKAALEIFSWLPNLCNGWHIYCSLALSVIQCSVCCFAVRQRVLVLFPKSVYVFILFCIHGRKQKPTISRSSWVLRSFQQRSRQLSSTSKSHCPHWSLSRPNTWAPLSHLIMSEITKTKQLSLCTSCYFDEFVTVRWKSLLLHCNLLKSMV